MKISQIEYSRCSWTFTLKNFFDDAMCMLIENNETLTAVTLKRIVCKDQY